MSFRFLMVFLLCWGTVSSAAEIVVNWAVPLKKEFASIKKREFAGVICRNGEIVVALRDGRVAVFDRAGRKLRERRFAGQFVVPPVEVAGGILVGESQVVRLLNTDLSDRWIVNGKSPLAAPPLVRPEGIYLQFVENTLYLVDPDSGMVRANYTFYGEDPLPYLLLANPISVGEKVFAGFSNGQIISFLYRAGGGSEELLSYNKYQTGDGQVLFGEKRRFFDLFSLWWDGGGTIFFSNGEKSGTVRTTDGRITLFEAPKETQPLRNVRFAPLPGSADEAVVAYGEGGVWLIGKEGVVMRKVLHSEGFVGSYTTGGGYALFADSSGVITLYDGMLTQVRATIRIPQGVSGAAARDGRSFYLLSDMGVLYSLGVAEDQKTQKILAKETKAGNNSAVLLTE